MFVVSTVSEFTLDRFRICNRWIRIWSASTLESVSVSRWAPGVLDQEVGDSRVAQSGPWSISSPGKHEMDAFSNIILNTSKMIPKWNQTSSKNGPKMI